MANDLPDVAAVILSWNDADRVVALLHALEALAPRPGRVIVVDNGSEAGVAGRIAAAFPRHDLVRLDRNAGFAGAVNRGIAMALDGGAAWVWLLNSDVELPVDALGSLLDAAAGDPRCGMAGALLVDADGRVQARGGGRVSLTTGMARHVRNCGEAPHYLSGACLLLRSPMLREIGLFDDGYFFYWEDVELAFRARDAGWTLAVADRCRVVHEEASSLGAWSEARWHLLFRGMRRFLNGRSRMPRTAAALRFAYHGATMLRHGRLDAVRGAWRGLAGGELPSLGPRDEAPSPWVGIDRSGEKRR